MKHLARLVVGMLLIAAIFWPYLFWWNNVAMAEAIVVIWIWFLVALAIAYGAGLAAQKLYRRIRRG